jgi:secreted trypsin-like serine protease
MTRRLMLSLAAVLAVGACKDAPTTNSDTGNDPSFITNGQLDGNAHPAVVLVLMEVKGQPAFRCSGTLIAPRVVLTAGHCAGEPREFSGIRIFTESDVENGDNNYPFRGPNSVEAVSWSAHPLYTNSAFFLHDVGVIKLKKSVLLSAGQYGKLPTMNQLDALQPSSATVFTAVGYGLQRSNPVSFLVEAERIRMNAQPHLIQINTGFTGNFSLLLSNNASTGGTCFGDSGGPNYLGSSNVIAGVTSFGLNGSCGGTGGVFRMDRADVLAFVNQYLN